MWPANTSGSCFKVHTYTQIDYFYGQLFLSLLLRNVLFSWFKCFNLWPSAKWCHLIFHLVFCSLSSIASSVLCYVLYVLRGLLFFSILMCGMSEIGCLPLFPASMSLSRWPPAIKGQLEVTWGFASDLGSVWRACTWSISLFCKMYCRTDSLWKW